MRSAARLVVVILAGCAPACSDGATATLVGLDAQPEVQDAAVESDATEPDSEVALDASPDAPVMDAGSRCTLTSTTVSCTHNVTTLKPSGSITRDVYWQTPSGGAPTAGFPVAVLFQGSFAPPALSWGTLTKGTPYGAYHQGLLQAKLLERGFIVVAPSAMNGVAWQTNTGGNWTDSEDHVVVQTLLAELQKGSFGPADMKRLFAAGISSGGYMTSRMAVSYAGKFRALAIQSGSYATCLGAACAIPSTLPTDHPPTLFLHGSLDTTVPQWTARLYFDKLVSLKHEADWVVDPIAGHEWLSVAPDRIVSWFASH